MDFNFRLTKSKKKPPEHNHIMANAFHLLRQIQIISVKEIIINFMVIIIIIIIIIMMISNTNEIWKITVLATAHILYYYYHFVGHCGAFCGLKWRI